MKPDGRRSQPDELHRMLETQRVELEKCQTQLKQFWQEFTNSRAHHRGRGHGRAITMMAAALCLLTTGGVALATSPVANNLVSACYNKKTLAVSVAKSGKCSSTALPLRWNQFTQLQTSAPLSVTPGSNGTAPSITLSGPVSSAQSFLGALTGDVIGHQGSTTVSGLRGEPLSSAAPAAGQVLGFDGTEWKPTDVPNLKQVAELRWYGANRAGNTVSVGSAPWGSVFDGSHIWVSNSGGSTLSEI